MNLGPFGKAVILVSLVAAAFFTLHHLAPGLLGKLVPAPAARKTAVPKREAPAPSPPEAKETEETPAPAAEIPAASMPGTRPGCINLPEVRFLHGAWNAQMGLMFATGGRQATEGSLMCSHGVHLKLLREDDTGKRAEALIAFARELAAGTASPELGAPFIAILGDGSAAFLRGVNDNLSRLGPGYTAKVVGSAGYSRGEDRFMGLPEWKAKPAASRGGLVAGTLRDGAWNIVQKWLADNGLCNNPDDTAWDPDCLNWVAAADSIDAGEKYIANYCETRPVVRQGRRTGAKTKVCVNGVATRTPGDVNVATRKGGLVSIVSTQEYGSQTPDVIVGIDRWMKGHPKIVEGLLAAVFEGGDQVKTRYEALHKAAEVSAEVYQENDAAYWERYYLGVKERDKQGLLVDLGGSSVSNLADNLVLFGLVRGSSNLFGATYRVFGDVVKQQYPDLVPAYPPVEEILDTSYLEAIAGRSQVGQTTVAAAAQPTFRASEPVSRVVSRRAWQITFETGSATFTPDAERELETLLRDLLIASGTVVEVHGHTDNVGSLKANLDLSEARAFAVKEWLEKQAPVNFPEGRVRVFAYGPENPVAPNATEAGRAKNRRVEIVIGTTG
jgi:outer membrane protein OmpA-like peptidoglycan-associated protein